MSQAEEVDVLAKEKSEKDGEFLKKLISKGNALRSEFNNKPFQNESFFSVHDICLSGLTRLNESCSTYFGELHFKIACAAREDAKKHLDQRERLLCRRHSTIHSPSIKGSLRSQMHGPRACASEGNEVNSI